MAGGCIYCESHWINPCLPEGGIVLLGSPVNNPPDDAVLLQAVARRDEAAFTELYDRLSRPVYSLIVRALRSRAEADEVLQEVFWQIWERAPDYRVELGSAFCWIVTIARRRAIDRVRANARHLQRIEEA